jgi:signal transduction histidine kinase
VLNAIDAMPEGGKLSVAVTPDSLQRNHEQIARRAVKIEVSDTGKGMSPETIDQIYEPFFTTKAKGTGLGLYISYGIIRSLHGTIDVASQLDHGTTFTIRLPVEQP